MPHHSEGGERGHLVAPPAGDTVPIDTVPIDTVPAGGVPPGSAPAGSARLDGLTLEDKVALLTGADNWHTRASPAIALRAMAVSDGPAGVRGVTMDERSPSASLPCPSALSATWDPPLVRRVARALGAEARSKGIDMLLGPTINMMRTPLGGRGFESFGEDPVLAAAIAVAFTEGVQAAGVAATLKHFVGNDSETQRMTVDVRIAPHVLRELYLVPFEACVTAGAAAVMTGYNKVNGIAMTEHDHLIREVLKDEWGFQGVVVSDWGAAKSTLATAHAGLDLLMPGPDSVWGAKLVAAVKAGEISEAAIDDKVRRVVRLAHAFAAPGAVSPRLADPGVLREAAAASFTLLRNDGTLPLDPDHIGTLAIIGPNAIHPVTQGGGSATVKGAAVSMPATALRSALPGTRVTVSPGCTTWEIVPEPPADSLRDPSTGEPGTRLEFLATDGTLFGSEHRNATMFTWWDRLSGGRDDGLIVLRTSYRPSVTGPHVIGAGGIGALRLFVNGTVAAAGITPVPADPVQAMVRPAEIRATVDMTAGADVEVAVELLPSNWAHPPVAIRLGIVPEPDEDRLLDEAVAAAAEADAAIVIVGSAPTSESEGYDREGLALPGRQDELVRRVAAVNDKTVVVVNAGMPVLLPWADEVAAAGYCWLPGQSMGGALADVLLGKAEPAGRLPVTIPRAEADCPVFHAVPSTDGVLEYAEGLLIGYRGYDKAGTEPHFPFGHGLGYTTWAYESCVADGEDIVVRLRNTGSRAGREVVQAYVEPPVAGPGAAAGRPVRVLAAFGAVTADPGEAVTLRLTLPRRAFAQYREADGTGATPGWTWPAGTCTVRIGSSSRHLPLSLTIPVPAPSP